MRRFLGFFLMSFALFAVIGEVLQLKLPTVYFLFNWIPQLPFLGGFLTAAFFFLGLYFFVRSFHPLPPLAARRWRHFCQNKRGLLACWIFASLIGVSLFDQVLVGNQALAIKYQGQWYFPAFQEKQYRAADFGLTEVDAPANYRKLQTKWKQSKGGFILMPLIPFSSTQDTVEPLKQALESREGVWYLPKKGVPYSGLASVLYESDSLRSKLRFRVRNGIFEGGAEYWDQSGKLLAKSSFSQGNLRNGRHKETFVLSSKQHLFVIHYHPAPPSWKEKHYLGTTSQGYDLLAYLYGGLQTNLRALLFFIPTVYFVGILIGLLMGYCGKLFDLVLQRLIEIFSNTPVLFILIILSSQIPPKLKEKYGLEMILLVLVAFGWMGLTYLLRTAAYREKSRDYILAIRGLGASNLRVLFHHLLPNTIAIVVTVIPFSVSYVILSLTALDYLGFGLPANQASWGYLLADGLENLSATWLVMTPFIALVSLLLIVSFIGESIREAFDSKKQVTWR